MNKNIPILFDEEYAMYNAQKNEIIVWSISSNINNFDPLGYGAPTVITLSLKVNDKIVDVKTPSSLFLKNYRGLTGWMMLGEL